MDALLKISDGLSSLVSWVGRIAMWLFIPMIATIVIDVVGRKVIEVYPGFTETIFYLGSTRLQEAEWHMHGVLFMMCLGFAYIKDAHVRIELARDHFPPKVRAWIELIGSLVFLTPYCYIVLTFGFTFAERAFISGEVSSALTGLPQRWIIKGMLPLGFTVLAFAAISIGLRSIVYLFGPEHLRKAAGRYCEHQKPEQAIEDAASPDGDGSAPGASR